MDLVSVIVPVYNVEKYLAKCIDSIIAQTYQNLEIILVDDGSTDSSPAICDEYALIDRRIKVVHKSNGGLSDARNCGINISKGDFICFIDSDDYIAEDMLKILLTQMLKDGSGMAICNFLYVDEQGKSIEERNGYLPIQNGIFTKEEILIQTAQTHFAPYTAAWNKLYKKSLFENIEFPYGKTIEDAFVAHEIVDKCSKISCIERPLYYYVQRNDSIMGVKFNLARLDGVEAFAKRAVYAIEKENLVLAIFSVRLMIAWMIKGLRSINKTEEFKHRFRELKQIYIIVSKKISKKDIGIKCKLQFGLFRFSPQVYNLVAHIAECFSGKSFYSEI